MSDPYTTPIPGASGYEAAALAAKTAYGNALTRLNQQRGDTLRQYGYAGDIDPTNGTISNIRVDGNLPYGMYQQARQSHADQYESARQGALDRGLHGGLANHAITRLRSSFGADDAQLGQGLSGAISGFQDQQNQAKYQQDSALADAQLQAARDAIAAQQFNAANVDGLSVEDGPDWGALIKSLLGGDDTPPPPGPQAAPAPNSKNSGAAMKTLLNGPLPVKKPAAPAKKPTTTKKPKAV